jgi:4-amino-4-deoxy-L-arabinose transferase-like glycosyltransferase
MNLSAVQSAEMAGAPAVPQAKLAALTLIALFALIYVGAMFTPALLDDADATHAEAAHEMAATGDFVTLHINGVRYLEKAPLLYWSSAVGMSVFGGLFPAPASPALAAVAARLPIVLAIGLLALLAWRWSRRAFGETAAQFAALFTLTAAGVFLFTRILIPEALLALFIGATFYFFLTALEDRRAWRWYAGYTSLALAVLTKGLVALIFVGSTAFVFVATTGDWRRWREFRLATGLLLFLAIAAPWHLLAGVRNPGFFWFYFVNEHFLRFLGRRWPRDYNKLPAFAYWALHLVWLFPWSVFFLFFLHPERTEGAIPNPISRGRVWLPHSVRDVLKSDTFAARTRLFCWLWAALILLFFAFSTNQEYYTFPAYLPLLILAADAVARELDQPSRWATAAYVVFAIVAVGAASALGAGLWSSRHLPFVADIGAVLEERSATGYTLSMQHFLDLTGASFAALRAPAALAAAGLFLGAITALALRLRRRPRAAVWTVGITMATLLVAAHLALVRFEPYLSSRPLAERLRPQLHPADRVMIYGDQAFGSSLLFYLQRRIELVNGRSTSMEFGSRYPDAPPIFLDDAALLRAWAGDQRVFLFAPRERRSEVEALLPRQRFVIAESSGKAIYSNQP